MARSTARSSPGADALLFKPEPPMMPKHVKRLFFGREKEFDIGLQDLRKNLDVAAARSKKSDKHPWVIHGESRSGKSHLARRIHCELSQDKKRMSFIIPAQGRRSALAVLKDLFEMMQGEFNARLRDESSGDGAFEARETRTIRQIVENLNAFHASTISVELTEETGGNLGGGVSLELGAPLLGKFLAKTDGGNTSKESRKHSLRPPNALDLAEVCGVMAENLLRFKRINHVLVLVDDLDLLDSYPDAGDSPSNERMDLAHALQHLHETPGVDVVLTARSYWYAHARKKLNSLIDLSRSAPFEPEQLWEIYQRRIELYADKNFVFLDETAVKRLADDVDGLPGVFLQHLESFFSESRYEDDQGPRDYDWVTATVKRQIERYRRQCGPAMSLVESVVREGKHLVEVDGRKHLMGTVLDNEIVFQSYYDEKHFFISGLFKKVIRAEG